MKFLLGILLAVLSYCNPKTESQKTVERQRTPPLPVEYLSDYDRQKWEAGCKYDELEWNFHEILEWDCN